MSVLIKDINMPNNCLECPVKAWEPYYEEYVCPFSGIVCLSIGKQNRCPLIEVPSDVDFIDAKKLANIIKNNAYIVHHGYNEVEYGMTVDGIMQSIKESRRIIGSGE